MDLHIRRTFEPFKFLSRLTVIPIPRIARGTRWVTVTSTHEAEAPFRYAPTVVLKAGPLPFGVGIGWWLDTEVMTIQDEQEFRREVEEANAEYERYVAVNGEVDREEFQRARKEIAGQGLDPDEEMRILQERGLFE